MYGGLNVHPSLLPDLRGAAPIEHAILRRRDYTGVSIQTLHPQHFDRGLVLAQTPAPGVSIPWGTTATRLETQLAQSGADMLVNVLKTRSFVQPVEDAGWYASSDGPIDHAPKIQKQDRSIDLKQSTLEDLLAAQYALGDTWCTLPNGDRLILHKVVDTGRLDPPGSKPGFWAQYGSPRTLMLRDALGRVGIVEESTYAGGKAGMGNDKMIRLLPKDEQVWET